MTWRDQIDNNVVEPSAIRGLPNGQLPDNVLVDVRNGDGIRIGRLCAVAARAWTAMVAAARADGIVLDATDTYRTLEIQKSIFADRYRTIDQGNGHRVCGRKRWYLRKGKATAACPGTSNHGRGLAVDNRFHGKGLAWLETNARRFGWAWETPTEDWHIHYLPGDHTPQAVLDFENNQGADDDMKIITPTIGPDAGKAFLAGNGKPQHIETTRQLDELTPIYGKPVPVSDVAWDVIRSTGKVG